MRAHSGFTLMELIIVLVLMSLAAALVVPSLLPPRQPNESGYTRLVRSAREVAVRRAETVHLRVTDSGEWTLDGDASRDLGRLAHGWLDDFGGTASTLVISPIGTCAPDVRTIPTALLTDLDPLSCQVPAP